METTQKQIAETYGVSRKTVQRWQDAAIEVLGHEPSSPYSPEESELMHYLGQCCSDRWVQFTHETGITQRLTPKQCCQKWLGSKQPQQPQQPSPLIYQSDRDTALASEDEVLDQIAGQVVNQVSQYRAATQVLVSQLQQAGKELAMLADPNVQRQIAIAAAQQELQEIRAGATEYSPSADKVVNFPPALPESLKRLAGA
jgi:hypothetical protein